MKPRTDDAQQTGVSARPRSGFSPQEWIRLSGFYLAVGLLHAFGCGLYLYFCVGHPALVGLGLAAYLLGLRHALDADHIAAVDDTVRYLMQQGQRPLGLGFFFSLGHSTIVFLMSVLLIVSASTVRHQLPWLHGFGNVIGAGVSALFLWLIGMLNLLVLLDILKIWRRAGGTSHSHAHLDELLARRGLINRLFGSRLRRFVGRSWQMYPVGLLFGLGLDTASEVVLLAMTAGAASGNLPVAGALSLPILFTAGMSLVDTTDGVLMSKVASWAFISPLRKIVYNVTVTGFSTAIALFIGTVEMAQLLAATLHLHGSIFRFANRLDFSALGLGIVVLFTLAWVVSVALWKWGRFDARGPAAGTPPR